MALGDEILVGCVVKRGTLGPYHISWQKDGADVQSTDRVSVTAQSKNSVALRITAVRPEDVSNYTCLATNSIGSDSFTAPLVVHGKEIWLLQIFIMAQYTQIFFFSVVFYAQKFRRGDDCFQSLYRSFKYVLMPKYQIPHARSH